MDTIINAIEIAFTKQLPGLEAQIALGRRENIDLHRFHSIPEDAIKSAVLIILFQKDNEVFIPFIVRATDGRVHSGQIAFPGGKFEVSDQSLLQTALREAAEEIGINPVKMKVLGQLTPLYIPPSNFVVYPYVALAKQTPIFKIDTKEVAALLELPLTDFLAIDAVKAQTFAVATGEQVHASCFDIQGHLIWGATAMIMNELLEMVRSN